MLGKDSNLAHCMALEKIVNRKSNDGKFMFFSLPTTVKIFVNDFTR